MDKEERTKYLFIYGSLLPALEHPAFESEIKEKTILLGTATTRGELFFDGKYPCGVFGDYSSNVSGVLVLVIDESVFLNLDKFEGCSPLDKQPYQYVRLEIEVEHAGKIYKSDVYNYNFDVELLTKIHSGDFLEFCFRKSIND